MKKTILAMTAAGAMGFTLTGHAQSSVTLYGLIDEGLNFTTNAAGSRGYQMVSGDTVGSRWGLKGAEDLGGGSEGDLPARERFRHEHRQAGAGIAHVRPPGVYGPRFRSLRHANDGPSV